MATAADTRPEVRALAKWVRISPRKARLVTEHIRGRTVPEARTILAFTPRAAAREVEKVLRSAVANAEANHGLIGNELVVETAFVDEGVTLKRWRPQARGRAHRIRKRTCHITISLTPLTVVSSTELETPRRRRGQEPEAVERVEEAPAVEEEEIEEPDAEAAEAEQPEAEAEADQPEERPKSRRRRRAKAEPEPDVEQEPESESEKGES
jgi:large subunit ribosomal protein L22